MSIDLSRLTPAPWDTEHCVPRNSEESHYVVTDAKGAVLFDTINSEVAIVETDYDETSTTYHDPVGRENLEFAALARNAFDVMMRRHFSLVNIEGEGFSVQRDGDLLGSMWIGITGTHSRNIHGKRLVWLDPFTALVEADKWMTEQEAASGQV